MWTSFVEPQSHSRHVLGLSLSASLWDLGGGADWSTPFPLNHEPIEKQTQEFSEKDQSVGCVCWVTQVGSGETMSFLRLSAESGQVSDKKSDSFRV